MKINSKQTLKALDGTEIPDGKEGGLTLGKILAIILTSSSAKAPDPLRSYALGIKVYNADTEVEVSESDIAYLKGEITKNQSYTPLVLGQIIQILDALVPEAEKKEETGGAK